MKLADIPVSAVLGCSDSEAELAQLLGRIAENEQFTHSAPIEGTSVSGRIFSTERLPEMFPLPQPSTGDDIALQLMLLTQHSGARYDPVSSTKHKGWQISRALINAKPVAIAWATWCTR